MHEDVAPAQRASPLTALRRRWRLGALLSLFGLTVGVLVALLLPASFTAESRLAVGSGELREFQVPGFALASQQLAANYARYVDGQENQSRLVQTLGPRASTISKISSSPVPESSIIRIEVTGTEQDVTIAAADAVAKTLMTQINTTNDDQAGTLLQRFNAESVQITQTQNDKATAQLIVDRLVANQASDTRITQARLAVAQADAALSTAQLRQRSIADLYQEQLRSQGENASNKLRLIQTARTTGNNTNSLIQLLGMAGLVLGAGLAVIIAVLLDRRRPTTPSTPTTPQDPPPQPLTNPIPQPANR